MNRYDGLSGKLLRILLVCTFSASFLPLLPRASRAADPLLASASVEAVNEDLRALGLEIDARSSYVQQASDHLARIYGLKERGFSPSDENADRLPLCVVLMERDGVLDHVQLITLDRSSAGPRLIMELTTAADPLHSVIFTMARGGGDGSRPGIVLSARDRVAERVIELGVITSDESDELVFESDLDRISFGCVLDCVATWLTTLGYLGAAGMVCCILAAGIVGITAGVATAGGAIPIIIPILASCLASMGLVINTTSLSGFAACVAACIFV